MKKYSEMLTTAVASVMALAMLAGCGETAATNSSSGSDANATAATATEASAPADGAVFKIGAIGPLTGGAAAYGNAVCNAAELAVEEINAAGGIMDTRLSTRRKTMSSMLRSQ